MHYTCNYLSKSQFVRKIRLIFNHGVFSMLNFTFVIVKQYKAVVYRLYFNI